MHAEGLFSITGSKACVLVPIIDWKDGVRIAAI